MQSNNNDRPPKTECASGFEDNIPGAFSSPACSSLEGIYSSVMGVENTSHPRWNCFEAKLNAPVPEAALAARRNSKLKGPCALAGACDGTATGQRRQESLIGVIHAGAEVVSFSVFTSPDFLELATCCEPLQIFSPQEGWYEVDPMEIMDAIHICCAQCCATLAAKGYHISEISNVALTNQRESTVVWHSETGQPLYRVLAWNDGRTRHTSEDIIKNLPNRDANYYKAETGLPVSAQFPALKLKWLQDNVPSIRKAIKEGKCKAGTLDSWIVWNLTKGELHITDVTNASRTMLMNIDTLRWDPTLLKAFNIKADILPQIRSCSELFGRICAKSSVLRCKLLTAIIGNQQASLMGQMCLKPGQTICSYRSSCFIICNTGTQHVNSKHGLLATIAYKMGSHGPTVYALEGVAVAGGEALDFLQNNVRILPDISKAEEMAKSVLDSGDVYFVPAFTGLYSPYWCPNARGIIVGLTEATKKENIIRAAFEAICFQVCDIIENICKDAGFCACKFYADGIYSEIKTLMQMQSDLSGIPVLRSQLKDTTTFGAALCAAHAVNIDLSLLQPSNRNFCNLCFETFLPDIPPEERLSRLAKWKRAVKRSMGWLSDGRGRTRTPTGKVAHIQTGYWFFGLVIPMIFFIIWLLLIFSPSREYQDEEAQAEFVVPRSRCRHSKA